MAFSPFFLYEISPFLLFLVGVVPVLLRRSLGRKVYWQLEDDGQHSSSKPRIQSMQVVTTSTTPSSALQQYSDGGGGVVAIPLGGASGLVQNQPFSLGFLAKKLIVPLGVALLEFSAKKFLPNNVSVRLPYSTRALHSSQNAGGIKTNLEVAASVKECTKKIPPPPPPPLDDSANENLWWATRQLTRFAPHPGRPREALTNHIAKSAGTTAPLRGRDPVWIDPETKNIMSTPRR